MTTETKLRTAHVHVRLKGLTPRGDWKMEWRQVQAYDLTHAFEVAEQAPDVVQAYETSWIPGGVVT